MTLLATRSIDPAERGAWLRLIRTRRVGPHSFWSLLDRFETAQAALAALPELSRQGGAKQPLQPFAADLAEQEYRALRDLGGHLLVAVDGVFPPLLRQINDPPPVLSVRGNPDLLAQPSVAMVGARNASTNGQHFAAALAQSLGAEGFSLTSGLARGIDAAVHSATVEDGQTVKPGAQPLTKLADDDVGAARDSLLKCLGPTPCSIDELFRECQVPARLGAAALVELELGGTVERTAGNLVCRLI